MDDGLRRSFASSTLRTARRHGSMVPLASRRVHAAHHPVPSHSGRAPADPRLLSRQRREHVRGRSTQPAPGKVRHRQTPATPSALLARDSWFTETVPTAARTWGNEVTRRSVEMFTVYRPCVAYRLCQPDFPYCLSSPRWVFNIVRVPAFWWSISGRKQPALARGLDTVRPIERAYL